MRKRTVVQPLLQNNVQPPAPPSVTMRQDINDFLLERRTRSVAAKTIVWYDNALAKFSDFCATNGAQRTTDITPRLLRAYIVHLGDHGHNTGGISNLYRAVRSFLRWCCDEYGLPTVNEALRKVSGPVPSTEPLDPLDLKDFQSMLAQCPPRTFNGERDRAILLTLLDTGARQQELTNLCLDDLNLDTGSIHIREGKGGKSRTVFVGLKARRALTMYLRYRDSPLINALRKKRGAPIPNALWLTDEGTPLTKEGIRKVIQRRANRAGIHEPGLHEFRRAFAINSLRNGMDVITLQRLLGHSSLAIINRYLKLLTDDLRVAHEKYGVADRL